MIFVVLHLGMIELMWRNYFVFRIGGRMKLREISRSAYLFFSVVWFTLAEVVKKQQNVCLSENFS